MFRVLASVLFLGLLPPAAAAPENIVPLPSIELLSISSPSPLTSFKVPAVSASGVLLLDALSGEKIFGRNDEMARPMGSLTKIMTAIVILENHDPEERVMIPKMPHVEGSAIYIKEGQIFSIKDLLKGLLIQSANDAAYALAIIDSKTPEAFVAKMNERAAQLGLKDTHFKNPAGFDAEGQYSSPRDLAWLSSALLRKPLLKKIVNLTSTTIVSSDGTEFPLINTNELLKAKENVEGVKTGTTVAAGECLITLFHLKDRSYLLVLLGSNARYQDASRVMQALTASLL